MGCQCKGGGGGSSGNAEACPPILRRCRWLWGDAQDLPFEDESVDAATMGYGLRNVTDMDLALRQIHRILKPGEP